MRVLCACEESQAVCTEFRRRGHEAYSCDILPCGGVMSTVYRKPDQVIQPWQFGHGETKATCLWLKGLPPLVPTGVVDGREARVHRMPPGPDRARMRSRTYPGVARAMAEQWG